jgi:hypothetical protein
MSSFDLNYSHLVAWAVLFNSIELLPYYLSEFDWEIPRITVSTIETIVEVFINILFNCLWLYKLIYKFVVSPNDKWTKSFIAVVALPQKLLLTYRQTCILILAGLILGIRNSNWHCFLPNVKVIRTALVNIIFKYFLFSCLS